MHSVRRRLGMGVLVATIIALIGGKAVLAYTPPRISIMDAEGSTVAESGTTDTFEVVLTEEPASDVVIDITSLDMGEVTAEGPLEPTDQLLFEPGTWDTPQTVTLTGIDDVVIDGDQITQIRLSVRDALSDDSWHSEPDQVVSVITTDDDVPEIWFSGPAMVTEGDELVFTVTLTSPYPLPVTVSYETSEHTALAGLDFVYKEGILTFNPGDALSQVIRVTTLDDASDEYEESFSMELSNPSNATLGSQVVLGIILDDDPLPSVSISDVTVTEGDSGDVEASFEVTVSPASGKFVTVDYSTSDGTAVSPDDYTPVEVTTLTFDLRQASKEITIRVVGDTLDENDETFEVVLSNPVNASITDGVGVGTIADDDVPEIWFSGPAMVTEGDELVFTVTLTSPYPLPVTVSYETSEHTALAGLDFVYKEGILTFNPGDALSQEIRVTTVDDASNEYEEAFAVELSNPSNATLGSQVVLGIILDDDPLPSVSISDVTVTEGDLGDVEASFEVTVSPASGKFVTVDYSTSDGTAVSPDDYTPVEVTTLTFDLRQASKEITIRVMGEMIHEGAEAFTVNLVNPSNAQILDGTAVGTIEDNDPQPSLSISDAAVSETSGVANFLVTLSNPSAFVVSVDYATADGSATAGLDYTPVATTLHFDSGQTSKIVSVPVLDDLLLETSETFTVELSGANGAILSDHEGLGTITDDDQPEIDVQRPVGAPIPDRGTDDLGVLDAGSVVLTYTIDNTAGKAQLTIPAGGVTASSLVNCSGFALHTPLPLDVAAGKAVDLQISFELHRASEFGLDLRIVNNDDDERPYTILIRGQQLPDLEVVPLGASGEGMFLDRGLGLEEGGTAPMVGLLPLSAVYSLGETITGRFQILNAFNMRPTLSCVHVIVYRVVLGPRPKMLERQLMNRWIASYDWSTHTYFIGWDTSQLEPGFYDLYLAFADETNRTLRIELLPAPEE